MFKRLIISFVTISFILSYYQPIYAQDFSLNELPMPGTMVGESEPFTPLALKGLVVNPQKPLEFQFIVDTGRGPQDTTSVKDQANQLVKYFLAGLTIPEGDLWVNLSPYEKGRITTPSLGQTELGRDLLAQDYILKQLTASLIYPEKNLGKKFWSNVYARAQEQFGTTNIPVNTFNKVWILPDQAQVFEHGAAAYVTKSTLKVMLDEDYLALQKHEAVRNGTDAIGANIIREIIIPEITKEINVGKNFATLRQIYQALILAKWYKETIQNGLLDAVYTNKNKVAGVNLNDPAVKEQIYNRYLQAYKKGAFNYIKEDPTPEGQVVPRKYFSGGLIWAMKIDPTGKQSNVNWDGAMVAITEDLETPGLLKDAAMTVFEGNSKIEISDAIDVKTVLAATQDREVWNETSKEKWSIFISGIPESIQNKLLTENSFNGMVKIDVRELLQPGKEKGVLNSFDEALAADKVVVVHHFTEGQNDLGSGSVMKLVDNLRLHMFERKMNAKVYVLAADFVDLRIFPEMGFDTPFYNSGIKYFYFDGSRINKTKEPWNEEWLSAGATAYQKKIDALKPGEMISLSLKDMGVYDFYNISLRVRHQMLSKSPGLKYIGNGVWRNKSDTVTTEQRGEESLSRVDVAMIADGRNLQSMRSFYEEQGYGPMRRELTIAQTWIEPHETANETRDEALEQMKLIARTVKRFNILPKDSETLFSLKYLVMLFNRNIKDLKEILDDPDVRPEIIRMLVDGAHTHGYSIKIFNELKKRLKRERDSQKGKGLGITAGLPAINTVAPVKFKLSAKEKSGHTIEAEYDGELQNFHCEATYYLTDDGYLIVSDMRSNWTALDERNKNKVRDWGTRLLQEIKKIAQQHGSTILYPSFPVHGQMYLYHGIGSVVLYRQFCKLPYDNGFRLATMNINRPALLTSTLFWVFKSNNAIPGGGGGEIAKDSAG